MVPRSGTTRLQNMKNIIPALNQVQLSCMTLDHTANQRLGEARKALMLAIRQAICEGMVCANPSPNQSCKQSCDAYLAKFDKLQGD